jgi:hypothetical protein
MQSPLFLLIPSQQLYFNKNPALKIERAASSGGQGKDDTFHVGRAMSQAVSRRPLTAEARVRSRVSPCGICGG